MTRSKTARFTADNLPRDIMIFHAGLKIKQERDLMSTKVYGSRHSATRSC
ncbi:MAG: hypothetical protein Q6373_019840 [Candidatus Sigynarchaeota archaeon]